MIRKLAVVAALLASASQATPARALNEDVMRNLLAPVYLAQNLIAVCGRLDPDFAKATGGATRAADEIIKHMEEEIIAKMTREEAGPIVISAAGAARAVGLGMIRMKSGGSLEEQTERLKLLCEQTAKPFVKGVVDEHETRHDFFEQALKDACYG